MTRDSEPENPGRGRGRGGGPTAGALSELVTRSDRGSVPSDSTVQAPGRGRRLPAPLETVRLRVRPSRSSAGLSLLLARTASLSADRAMSVTRLRLGPVMISPGLPGGAART